MPKFNTLKSYSYRNAPTKLIPAIIACKCVPYLIIFGLFVTLTGLIPLFLSRDIVDYSVDTNNDTNITDTKVPIIFDDLNTTTIIGDNGISNRSFDYLEIILYACVGFGSLLLLCGLICLIIAYYYYTTYQKDRIRHIQITDLDSDNNQSVITDPIIDGIGYPINTTNSKSLEYFPISQTSVVYKPTTEPNI